MEVAPPKERKKAVNGWPDEHSDWLRSALDAKGVSYAGLAWQMNRTFGTTYSRNALIGRALRMGLCKPSLPRLSNPVSKASRVAAKRKAKRWAANPALAMRAQRRTPEQIKDSERERRENFAIMKSRNTTTSREYRMYLPRIPADTPKSVLRNMLTEAVRNTAAMEEA